MENNQKILKSLRYVLVTTKVSNEDLLEWYNKLANSGPILSNTTFVPSEECAYMIVVPNNYFDYEDLHEDISLISNILEDDKL